MISTFLDSIADAIDEKPSVILIYLALSILAFIGLINLLDNKTVGVREDAYILACNEGLEIKQFLTDDGYLNDELLEEAIYDACSKDGDMREIITEIIIDDIREDLREEIIEELEDK